MVNHVQILRQMETPMNYNVLMVTPLLTIKLVKLPVTYETNHESSLTRAEQYQILMTHLMFTGCPQCRYAYPSDRLNWNCPICEWQSD